MSSLHSNRWHRVANLQPRLSPDLRLRRQRLRGETWYLLAAPGGASVRFNAAAWALAGRLDGSRTLQLLWDTAPQHSADAPTQDEVIEMLARLREAGLLELQRGSDFDTLLPHLQQLARPRAASRLLAWRVPLGNPARLLNALAPLQPWLFGRAALIGWLLAVATMCLLVLQHAPTLWAHGQQWLATPRYLTLALLLYVPIKLLHELAHGLAVHRWGGQVHQAGVTLMLLLPVPFVDASAASSFARRRQRIAVSAAGVMAELLLAALALPLWLWLDDGLARDTAFVTLAICGVSTLLFNANPLQRLDGYYILTDALDLPNLATRSRNWWLDLLSRRLLRLPGTEAMPVAAGELPWLAAYAPLSWGYSLLVAALAVAWLGQIALALGVAGALTLAWQVLLRPMLRLAQQLRRAAMGQADSARRWRSLALAGGTAVVLALLAPWPQRVLVQGVVWPTERSQLRLEEAGFVAILPVQDGQTVAAGALLLELDNPTLRTSHERQQARVSALEAGLFEAMPASGSAAADARAELAAAQTALARMQQRLAGLQLHAPQSGRVVLPRGADLAGQYVPRGELLGQMITDAAPTVRLALRQDLASDLPALQGPITVWLAAAPHARGPATLARDSGGATLRLPSAALSERHGGTVATDPRDPDDLKPLQPVVLLDVQLDNSLASASTRIGERAWVRFDAGWAPLAWQWALGLRRFMLQRFNPQV